MKYGLLAVGILLVIAAVMAISGLLERRKLRRSLAAAFGRPPRRKYTEEIWESIASDWEYERRSDKPLVDDLTWNDLDMDRIFARINSAGSSVGEENLYAMLHRQNCDRAELERFERAVCLFGSRPDIRLEAQVALAELGRVTGNGILRFFHNPAGQRLRHAWLYPLLSLMAVASLLSLIPLHPTGAVFIVLMSMINILVYYRTKSELDAELTSVHYIASLVGCARRLSRLRAEELRPLTEKLLSLSAPLRRIGRMAGLVMGSSTSSMDFLSEYVKIFFMLDFTAYHRMLAAIRRHGAECRELYRLVGFLDSAIAVASYRKSVPVCCRPEFTESDEIHLRGLVHPLLSHPVPNTVTLRRSALITGSNASGKSTFVKAVAVNAILGQTIHTCLGEEFRFRPSFVVTSMAVRDDLETGESYYIAEIRSLKRILDRLGGSTRCLCLVDEILRGTNTVERIAASAAVLGYLSRRNCLALVATHDIELTEITRGRFDNFHFQEQVDDSGVHFDYRIREGRATTQNAIRLLDVMDYPPEIVRTARELAHKFLESRSWSQLP